MLLSDGRKSLKIWCRCEPVRIKLWYDCRWQSYHNFRALLNRNDTVFSTVCDALLEEEEIALKIMIPVPFADEEGYA